MSKKMYTPEEVAEIAGIGAGTMWGHLNNGRIPGVQASGKGGHWLITPAAAQAVKRLVERYKKQGAKRIPSSAWYEEFGNGEPEAEPKPKQGLLSSVPHRKINTIQKLRAKLGRSEVMFPVSPFTAERVNALAVDFNTLPVEILDLAVALLDDEIREEDNL